MCRTTCSSGAAPVARRWVRQGAVVVSFRSDAVISSFQANVTFASDTRGCGSSSPAAPAAAMVRWSCCWKRRLTGNDLLGVGRLVGRLQPRDRGKLPVRIDRSRALDEGYIDGGEYIF